MRAKRLRVDHGMTLKEWGELPEDTYAELVDGVLVDDEMTTESHDALQLYLGALFLGFVGERGAVFVERKLGISRHTGRKPDVAVFLPGTRGVTGSARVTMAPPDITIEIVTPTPRDIRRDRVEKRRDYARIGVRWYWLVDPSLRTVEILQLSPKGRYEHVTDGSTGKLRIPGCRGLVLDLDRMWRRTFTSKP
jgi:Uma2 family endonuclease